MLAALATLLAIACFTSPTAFAQTKDTDALTVITSTYPGWMSNWLMEMKLNGRDEPTFLEARSKEFDAKVNIEKSPNYMATVKALVAGSVDACTMALSEAVTVVSDEGIDAYIILPQDYSNGNDQIQIPKNWTEEEIAGKTFLLEEFSVSHYLLYRYLQENDKPLKDYVNIKNTPGDDVAPAYIASLNGNDQVGGITWNPGAQRMLETGKSEAIFTSRDIPGEITDCLVIRKDRIKGRENAIAAYTAAHYDVMDFLKNPETREKAIRAMASAAGFTPAETPIYAKMLDATRFYMNPAEAKEALENPQLTDAMDQIRAFYKVYGTPNPNPGTLEVDTTFLKPAAE